MGRQGLYFAGGSLVTYLMCVASGSFGIAAIILHLLIPLPAAYLVLRFNPRLGGGVVLLTTILLLGLHGAGPTTSYLLQFGLASLLLPALLRKGQGWDRAVVLTLVAMALTAGVFLAGLAVGEGGSPIIMLQDYVDGEVAKAMTLYEDADLTLEQQTELQLFMEQLAGFMVKAFPGLLIAISGFLLLTMVILLGAVGLGHYQIPGVVFHLWKAPEILVWPMIAAGFSLFFLQGMAQIVALNTLVILLPTYFLQGLAIVDFFLRKKAFPPFLRAMSYMLLFIVNPLPLVVTGLGVFDLWADFRKPRIKKT